MSSSIRSPNPKSKSRSKSKSRENNNEYEEDYVTKSQRHYDNLSNEKKEMLRKYVERQNKHYKGVNENDNRRSELDLDRLHDRFRDDFQDEVERNREIEQSEEHSKNVHAYWDSIQKAEKSAERKKRAASFHRFMSTPSSDEVISQLTMSRHRRRGRGDKNGGKRSRRLHGRCQNTRKRLRGSRRRQC